MEGHIVSTVEIIHTESQSDLVAPPIFYLQKLDVDPAHSRSCCDREGLNGLFGLLALLARPYQSAPQM